MKVQAVSNVSEPEVRAELLLHYESMPIKIN